MCKKETRPSNNNQSRTSSLNNRMRYCHTSSACTHGQTLRLQLHRRSGEFDTLSTPRHAYILCVYIENRCFSTLSIIAQLLLLYVFAKKCAAKPCFFPLLIQSENSSSVLNAFPVASIRMAISISLHMVSSSKPRATRPSNASMNSSFSLAQGQG